MSVEDRGRIIQTQMDNAAERARAENRNLIRGPDGKPMVLSTADLHLKLPEPPKAIGSGKNDNIVLNRLPRDGFYRKNSKGEPTPDAKAIANQIFEKYHVIAFNGGLYVYEKYQGIFREDRGEVDHEIEAILDYIHWTGATIPTRREVKAHLLSKRVYADYPFDGRPDLLPFKNCCAKFSSPDGWVTQDRDLEHLFRYRLPVNLNLDLDTRQVDALFSQWVEPEDVLILYQAPAQALIQAMIRQPYKRSYLFMGQRNSGKTSYFELVNRAIGSENISRVPLQRLNSRFSLAPLEGKLLNIYDDLSNFEMSDVGTYKTLTGACEHQIERKHQNPYTGRITAVHMFTCNEPPKISKDCIDDDAFWGRWEYVIFPNSFRTDPTFYDRVFTPEFIQTFMAGVLKCALKILISRHLPRASAPEIIREKWVCAMDPIYRWIKEEFRRELGAFLPTEEIYQSYQSWCERNKVSAQDKNWLTRSLPKFGFAKRQVKRVHGYAGYNFATADPQRPAQDEEQPMQWFGGDNE